MAQKMETAGKMRKTREETTPREPHREAGFVPPARRPEQKECPAQRSMRRNEAEAEAKAAARMWNQ